MKPIAILVCASLVAACAGPRSGPGGPGRRPFSDGVPAAECLLKPFAAKDGSLSRAQLAEGVRGVFAAADRNGDGVLDVAETRALNESRKSSCDRSAVIDWSSTGRVGPEAFAARYLTAFERADTDDDGFVTKAEMDTAIRPMPMRDPQERPGRDPGASRPD
ncbi:MAG: hypothetical protein IT548_16785 [Alphaproteobacteria bacterium]|nr:hypothetical protein [Alphaproteobacteria bacterium]